MAIPWRRAHAVWWRCERCQKRIPAKVRPRLCPDCDGTQFVRAYRQGLFRPGQRVRTKDGRRYMTDEVGSLRRMDDDPQPVQTPPAVGASPQDKEP